MTLFQKMLVLGALSDAAYTDWAEQKVSDRVLFFLLLALPSVTAVFYSLCWGLGLWCAAEKTKRLGTGDVGVLALLSGVFSTELFATLCVLTTMLLSIQGSGDKQKILMPPLWISTIILLFLYP